MSAKVDTRAPYIRRREDLARLVVRLREVDASAFERVLVEIRERAAAKEPQRGVPNPKMRFTSEARFWRSFLLSHGIAIKSAS